MATEHPTRKTCECGCGQPTRIATRNDRTRGYVKGQALSLLRGHGRRLLTVTSDRYIRRNGRKLHITIAEAVLGKPLPHGAKVHHVDGNTQNNAHSNLVVCENQGYHLLLHARARVLRAGGSPSTQALCGTCHHVKDFSEFHRRNENGCFGGTGGVCKDCRRQRDRGRWRKGVRHVA